MSNNGAFERVTKAKPCAVCGKPDYCTRFRDSGNAICMRVESAKQFKNGGYLHKTGESNGNNRLVQPDTKKRGCCEMVTNWNLVVKDYCKAADGKIKTLAESLGVSADSLRALRVGWDGDAFCAPMRNHENAIIGIRRRFPDGKKLSVCGGKEGLFYKDGFKPNGQVLIVEGFTDTSAALSLGFDAIGRPSCTGGIEFLKQMCKTSKAIVVADDDTPGLRGARLLVRQLPNAKMLVPPTKDLRQWLLEGASKQDMEYAIASC